MAALKIISEPTRKIRKSLLIFSLIGYSISKIDVTISRVTVLGTEFRIGNFDAIPFVLGMIILFFLTTFFFYSIQDYYSQSAVIIRESAIQEFEAVTGLGYGPVSIKKDIDRAKKEQEQLSLISRIGSANSEVEEKQARLSSYIRKLYELLKGEEKLLYQYHGAEYVNTFFVWLRQFMEFWVPLIFGTYACILVFFFTEFKVVQTEDDKTQMTIKTEQVIIQHQLQTPPKKEKKINKKDIVK